MDRSISIGSTTRVIFPKSDSYADASTPLQSEFSRYGSVGISNHATNGKGKGNHRNMHVEINIEQWQDDLRREGEQD